jgi:hypothetical protein
MAWIVDAAYCDRTGRTTLEGRLLPFDFGKPTTAICRHRPLIGSLGGSLPHHSQLLINEFAEQDRQGVLFRQSARSAITMTVLCPPIVTRTW